MTLEDRFWDLTGRVVIGGLMAAGVAAGLVELAVSRGPAAALESLIVLVTGEQPPDAPSPKETL